MATNKQYVWIVLGQSESGDDYGPWVFRSKPSRKQLEAIVRRDCPGECEDEDGPGDFGAYVHLGEPCKVEVQ